MGGIEGYFQLITVKNKSNNPIKITGIDKIRLKCDCINGSIKNGIGEPIFYGFALDKPPGHRIHEESRIKLFIKINKFVLPQITFYLEGDDYKPVKFNGETISFTCQIVKKN